MKGNHSTHRPARHLRPGLLGLACIGLLGFTSCSVFMDQAEVPGTNQRLVVGGQIVFLGPLPKIWVLEGDRYESVKIKKELDQ